MPYGTPGLLLAAGGGYLVGWYVTPTILEKLGIPMSNIYIMPLATGVLVAGAGYLAGYQGSEGLMILGAEAAVVNHASFMMSLKAL